jgi:hypothetical protein
MSNNTTEERAVIPDGLYTLEISDISDKIEATYETRSLPEEKQIKVTKLLVEFTILDDKETEGQTLRGRKVWKSVANVYSPARTGKNPSNLYFLFSATHKKDVPMDLSNPREQISGLIGKQVQAVLKGKVSKNGKTYPEISFEGLLYVEDKNYLPSYAQGLTDTEIEEIVEDSTLPF